MRRTRRCQDQLVVSMLSAGLWSDEQDTWADTALATDRIRAMYVASPRGCAVTRL